MTPRSALITCTLLSLFALALYTEIFRYHTFGPEFPLFYFYNDGSFTQMLRSYTYTSLQWYRPTSFSLFYWIGDQFLSWHDLAAWKLFHLLTVIATGFAVYWLAARCLSAGSLAGVLAAVYFLAQPSLYAFVMEVAPFDFIYILLTIVCVGFYLRGGTGPSFVSWLMFVAALTAKEMALAIPGYLLAASAIIVWFDARQPLRARVRREALRLLPFFAMLPVYYFFHLANIPPGTFTDTGHYRSGVNWDIILANLRKFPLWIVRIYAFTGETLDQRMYQSNLLNNFVGALLLVMVGFRWIARGWRDRQHSVPLLMLAWCAVFLAMPVYAGSFIWHINLPVVGYSVLFGIGIAWWLEKVPAKAWRAVATSAFLVLFLMLSRTNLKTELYGGTHTIGFQINHSLIDHPPVARGRLGKSPLVFIEDRLGLGAWWYGCYGRLFNFVYLRRDIEEVIVPELAKVPQNLRKRWLAHDNAYFFRYDSRYRWRDASQDFRAHIMNRGIIQPAFACAGPGRRIPFSLRASQGGALRWSVDPPGAGTVDLTGVYTAPAAISSPRIVRVSAHREGDPNPLDTAAVRLGGAVPIRIVAGGPKVVDHAGQVWEEDSHYHGGQTYFTSDHISGTATPELYRNERFYDAPFQYRFCVPEGSYNVTLKFAEIWFTQAGLRAFDVAINGATVLKNFDVTAAAGGPRRAIDKRFRIDAVENEIRIEFIPVASNPKIAAIEITR